MLAEVLEPIETRQGRLEPGKVIDAPEMAIRKLAHKVRPLHRDSEACIEDGELKMLHPVPDLAAVIVGLTEDDLPLQKKLLRAHCTQYDPVTHFWALREKWEERAAIMEYDGGMSQEEAEYEAARQYHLLAFMDELKHPGEDDTPSRGTGSSD